MVSRLIAFGPCRGVAKLVKAPDFDSGMRGFESFLPCHVFIVASLKEFSSKPKGFGLGFFALLILGWIPVSSLINAKRLYDNPKQQ